MNELHDNSLGWSGQGDGGFFDYEDSIIDEGDNECVVDDVDDAQEFVGDGNVIQLLD